VRRALAGFIVAAAGLVVVSAVHSTTDTPTPTQAGPQLVNVQAWGSPYLVGTVTTTAPMLTVQNSTGASLVLFYCAAGVQPDPPPPLGSSSSGCTVVNQEPGPQQCKRGEFTSTPVYTYMLVVDGQQGCAVRYAQRGTVPGYIWARSAIH
jgi:hypothetical protein